MVFIGISQPICETINARLGVGSIPVFFDDDFDDFEIMGMIIGPSSGSAISDTADLVGQPQGCFFEQEVNAHVYYHVLIER